MVIRPSLRKISGLGVVRRIRIARADRVGLKNAFDGGALLLKRAEHQRRKAGIAFAGRRHGFGNGLRPAARRAAGIEPEVKTRRIWSETDRHNVTYVRVLNEAIADVGNLS
jgi:hypothetical protein